MARTNAEQWAKRVERWKDSGLSAKQFAAETGLKASTLSYWRWRLAAPERASVTGGSDDVQSTERPEVGRRAKRGRRPTSRLPACVELPVAAIANSPTMLELLVGDVRVRVPAGFDEVTLMHVVRALGVTR